MVNWVYHTDVTPRLPGHPDFWLPAVQDIFANMAKNKVTEGSNSIKKAVTWKLLFADGRLDFVLQAFERRTAETVEACRLYRHIAKLHLLSPYPEEEMEVMNNEEFKEMRYTLDEEDKHIQVAESEFLTAFHDYLPKMMARTSGYVKLRHEASKKCLAMTKAGLVYLTTSSDKNDDCAWRRRLVPVASQAPSASFRLESKSSGMHLAVNPNSLELMAESIDNVQGNDHLWFLSTGSDTSFTLINRGCDTHLALSPDFQDAIAEFPAAVDGRYYWRISRMQRKRNSDFA